LSIAATKREKGKGKRGEKSMEVIRQRYAPCLDRDWSRLRKKERKEGGGHPFLSYALPWTGKKKEDIRYSKQLSSSQHHHLRRHFGIRKRKPILQFGLGMPLAIGKKKGRKDHDAVRSAV